MSSALSVRFNGDTTGPAAPVAAILTPPGEPQSAYGRARQLVNRELHAALAVVGRLQPGDVSLLVRECRAQLVWRRECCHSDARYRCAARLLRTCAPVCRTLATRGRMWRGVAGSLVRACSTYILVPPHACYFPSPTCFCAERS